jgi:chromosomal replication initiation ATPase DnaA
MWSNGSIAPVTPHTLERAADNQRSQFPSDDVVLDRLFRFLDQTRPTLREIATATCEFYCLQSTELFSRARGKVETSYARQIFCFLAHRYTRFSMNRIGDFLNGRHHTTVLHAVRKIESRSISRPRVADDLDLLRLRIAEKILQRPFKNTRAS